MPKSRTSSERPRQLSKMQNGGHQTDGIEPLILRTQGIPISQTVSKARKNKKLAQGVFFSFFLAPERPNSCYNRVVVVNSTLPIFLSLWRLPLRGPSQLWSTFWLIVDLCYLSLESISSALFRGIWCITPYHYSLSEKLVAETVADNSSKTPQYIFSLLIFAF